MKDEELRRKAAEFYYTPRGITGYVEDWIADGRSPDGVDSDVPALAELLRAIAAAERERCAKEWETPGRIYACQTGEQVAAAIRAMGEGET